VGARQQQTGIGGIWQAFCAVLLIALLVGILVLESYRSAAGIGRKTAAFEVLTRTDALEAYVFRDEAAFHSSNNGPVEYLVGQGASIRAGDPVARVYVDDTNTGKRAAAAELYELDLDQIEYAAEMSIEHHLGLTCDPILGLVQIPCIERNAIAAMRALNAVNLADFLADSRMISFDMIVETMYETGKDLKVIYRETSEGGLAKQFKKD
jgi:hypothetical protein